MASTPNPTQMTPPRVAFIDERTGAISREWYRFLLSLWTASGTTQNVIETNTYETAALASYEASLNALAQAIEQSPDTQTALASCCEAIANIAQTFAQAPDVLSQEQSDISVIQKRIQALEEAPILTPQTPEFVYGAFYNTNSQPDGSTTTAYPIVYNSTSYSQNVSLLDRTAIFTASIATTTMTVTAISSGPIYPGMIISGSGVTVGTRIVSQTTGVDGGVGDYVVNTSQTVASTSITGVCKSKLLVKIPGIYNIQFSVQMVNTDSNTHDIDIWLRKNAVDVSETNSRFSVPSKHGAVDGHTIGALNLFIDLAVNDYVELMWRTNDATTTISYVGPQSSPTRPGAPSAIVTLNLASTPIFQGV